MNMNQYWEKYKNRNKSQEHLNQAPDKSDSNPILDYISHLQSQINSLEDKFLYLQCKFAGKTSFDSQIPPNPFQKPEKLEKIQELYLIHEERLQKLEQNNQFFKYENLRMDLIKELNLTESRINDFLNSELVNFQKRLKELQENKKEAKRPTVRFEDEALNGKIDAEWQKKIEKIVVICAEKIKNFEERTNPEVLNENQQKLKKFRIKVNKRLEELDDFAKRMCRKLITIENSSSNLPSPISKHSKNESNLSFTQKKNKELENRVKKEGKRNTSRSTSPTGKEKPKDRNKLEKLYKDLKDF